MYRYLQLAQSSVINRLTLKKLLIKQHSEKGRKAIPQYFTAKKKQTIQTVLDCSAGVEGLNATWKVSESADKDH